MVFSVMGGLPLILEAAVFEPSFYYLPIPVFSYTAALSIAAIIMISGVVHYFFRDTTSKAGLLCSVLSMVNLFFGAPGLGTVLTLIGGLTAYGSFQNTQK